VLSAAKRRERVLNMVAERAGYTYSAQAERGSRRGEAAPLRHSTHSPEAARLNEAQLS
jgi:hypothetical protein